MDGAVAAAARMAADYEEPGATHVHDGEGDVMSPSRPQNQQHAGSHKQDAEAHIDLELLLSLANGLGQTSKETGAYEKSEDCVECLRDIQRFLRRDDPANRPAFCRLASWHTVRADILPILSTYPRDAALVYECLKVLVFMTMPILEDDDAVERAGQTEEKCQQLLLDTVRDLLSTDSGNTRTAIAMVASLVAEPLASHPDMEETDVLTVQLVLTFFRNVLHAATLPTHATSAPESASTLKERLLSDLFHENVLELMLLLTQYTDTEPFDREAGLILEIISLVLDGIVPEDLSAQPVSVAKAKGTAALPQASKHNGSMGAEKAAPKKTSKSFGLREALQEEQRTARVAIAARHGTRHTKFTGAFAKRHVDGGNASVRRTALPKERVAMATAMTNSRMMQSKLDDVYVKTERTMGGGVPVRRLKSDRLRRKLREWCGNLLDADCYNVFMENLRDDVRMGAGISQLNSNDFERFLRVTRFFTRFSSLRLRDCERKLAEDRRSATGSGKENAATVDAREENADGAALVDVGDGTSEQPSHIPSPFAGVRVTLDMKTFHAVMGLWHGEIDKPSTADEKNWAIQGQCQSLLYTMLDALRSIEASSLDEASAKRLKLEFSISRKDKNAAEHITRALLYNDNAELGLLPTLGRLCKSFSLRHQTRGDACMIALCADATVSMYEKLVDAERGKLLVQRRQKRRAKRKQQQQQQGEGEDAMVPDAADAQEDEQEDEEDERRFVEETFDLKKRFMQEFAHPAAVQTLMWLLDPDVMRGGGLRANAPEATEATVALLRRLMAFDMTPMLQQLGHLQVANRLLFDRSLAGVPGASGAVRLARRLAADTVKSLLEDDEAARLGFVELLFHKSKFEALQVGRKYAPLEDVPKKSREPRERKEKDGTSTRRRKRGGDHDDDDDDFGNASGGSKINAERFFFAEERDGEMDGDDAAAAEATTTEGVTADATTSETSVEERAALLRSVPSTAAWLRHILDATTSDTTYGACVAELRAHVEAASEQDQPGLRRRRTRLDIPLVPLSEVHWRILEGEEEEAMADALTAAGLRRPREEGGFWEIAALKLSEVGSVVEAAGFPPALPAPEPPSAPEPVEEEEDDDFDEKREEQEEVEEVEDMEEMEDLPPPPTPPPADLDEDEEDLPPPPPLLDDNDELEEEPVEMAVDELWDAMVAERAVRAGRPSSAGDRQNRTVAAGSTQQRRRVIIDDDDDDDDE